MSKEIGKEKRRKGIKECRKSGKARSGLQYPNPNKYSFQGL